MKYALLILEDSKSLDSRALDLLNFANNVKEVVGNNQGVECLNVGSYLCSLEHGLHGLTQLVSVAESRELQSRTLFFDSDPSWVISKPIS